MKKFVRLENNIVISVRYAKEIVDGEIESVDGETGQLLENETFRDLTEEEHLSLINENNEKLS